MVTGKMHRFVGIKLHLPFHFSKYHYRNNGDKDEFDKEFDPIKMGNANASLPSLN